MESTGNCHYIDHYHQAGWDGAQANCVGLGANLISINSPQAQTELMAHTNDPDAIGKFIARNFAQSNCKNCSFV